MPVLLSSAPSNQSEMCDLRMGLEVDTGLQSVNGETSIDMSQKSNF